LTILEVWRKIKIETHFKRQWELTEYDEKLIEESIKNITEYKELIEKLVMFYAKKTNKQNFSFWVEHCPQNIIYANTLLEIFPDAKFIHIIRDGRAVANSLLKVNFGINTVYHASIEWQIYVSMAFTSQHLIGDRSEFFNIKYEDIVFNVDENILKLCNFFNINYEKEMHENNGYIVPKNNIPIHILLGKKPDKSRINDWQTKMHPEAIKIFEKYAHELLEMLGYKIASKNFKVSFVSKVRWILIPYFIGKIKDIFK